MVTPPSRRHLLVVFLLGLILIGAGGGFWNYQQIQQCHAEYDADPTVTVECEDSLTALLDLASVLLIGSGIVGLLVTHSVGTTE